MIDKILKYAISNYTLYRGTPIKKKIIVIESDDWGSIRIPSSKVYDILLKNGASVESSFFTKYDCLETNHDLERLFELLLSFKDRNGRHPSITANVITSNPDFKKIRESDFQEYFFENMDDTYSKYAFSDKVLDIWKSTFALKLLWPQYHGREHLNVREWMSVIKQNNLIENIAFENEALLGLPNSTVSKRSNSYMSALEFDSKDEVPDLSNILMDGLFQFKKIFGFQPSTFMPPCGIIADEMMPFLAKAGIKFLQSGRYFIPLGEGKLKKKDRFIGDKNEYGQTYWRRNVTFEPSKNHQKSFVDEALSQINLAFSWGKPAILNTHRVNFSGGISVANRDNTLNQFKQLLISVQKNWPDVFFCTSDELGEYLSLSRKA